MPAMTSADYTRDFARKTAELELLLMQCVASGGERHGQFYTTNKLYLRKVREWRQATITALENAYNAGYEDTKNGVLT